MTNTLKVTVVNWSKYNSNSTRVRRPNWFSLSNRLMLSRSLFGLNPTQKWIWVCLLAECSHQNSETITIDTEWFSHLVGSSKEDILQAIVSLNKTGALTTDCQSSVSQVSPDCQSTELTDRQTDRTDRQTIPASRRVSFDFEKLYVLYPRKEGKQKGIEKCKSQIKTQEDYEELTRAINRYRLYCEKRVSEPRFIKHFDTFMTAWRDYLDPDYGDTVVKVKSEYRGPTGFPQECNKSFPEGDPAKIKELMDKFRTKTLE